MADMLIRGMEMPKTCQICRTARFDRIVGCEEWDKLSIAQRMYMRSETCPLVPLPEGHGGLMAEWISVKERLPEQNQRVLVCGVRGGVQICRYWENRDYGGGLQYMFFTNKQRPITVTHWMPLPEPPKEGGLRNDS